MWEYRSLITAELDDKMLNTLGAEAWEHYMTIGNKHRFKRQINVNAFEEAREKVESGKAKDAAKNRK